MRLGPAGVMRGGMRGVMRGDMRGVMRGGMRGDMRRRPADAALRSNGPKVAGRSPPDENQTVIIAEGAGTWVGAVLRRLLRGVLR